MHIKNILIIEDDEIASILLCYLIEDVLKVTSVVTKSNGQEAFAYLEQVAARPDQFPDLIFLDLNMPRLSGHEFIEQYEAAYASSYPHTQLIVLTSSARKKDHEAALQYTAVGGFFIKPLEEAHLIDIKNKIEHRQA